MRKPRGTTQAKNRRDFPSPAIGRHMKTQEYVDMYFNINSHVKFVGVNYLKYVNKC